MLAAGFLLAGCAPERGVALPDMSGWQSRQAVLREIDDWAFSGRIGVSAGEEGFNGRLRWRQRQDDFEASLSGPLGAVAAYQFHSGGAARQPLQHRRVAAGQNRGVGIGQLAQCNQRRQRPAIRKR